MSVASAKGGLKERPTHGPFVTPSPPPHVIYTAMSRLAPEFRSENIPRNKLGMVSVIPRKKVVIPRHSEIYRRVNSEARNRTE